MVLMHVESGSNRENNLRKYQMTEEQYLTRIYEQNGSCAICQSSEENLVVDHDHDCCEFTPTCGKCTRGLLCDRCNRGLGFFKDNPEALVTAAEYIYQSRY